MLEKYNTPEISKTATIVVKCDKCHKTFTTKEISFKEVPFKIDDEKVTLVGYNCPVCGCSHTIAILDYYGKKLQEKFLNVSISIKTKHSHGFKVTAERIEEMEQLKKEAQAYQKELLHNKKDLIPEGIFK